MSKAEWFIAGILIGATTIFGIASVACSEWEKRLNSCTKDRTEYRVEDQATGKTALYWKDTGRKVFE